MSGNAPRGECCAVAACASSERFVETIAPVESLPSKRTSAQDHRFVAKIPEISLNEMAGWGVLVSIAFSFLQNYRTIKS